MELVVHHRELNGIAVLECRGRIVSGASVFIFSEIVHEVLHSYGTVVLNMKALNSLDCAGLGALAGCIRRALESGKCVRCLNAPPLLQHLFEMMRLDTFLRLPQSEHAVLAACA